jgi:hypothetical protein
VASPGAPAVAKHAPAITEGSSPPGSMPLGFIRALLDRHAPDPGGQQPPGTRQHAAAGRVWASSGGSHDASSSGAGADSGGGGEGSCGSAADSSGGGGESFIQRAGTRGCWRRCGRTRARRPTCMSLLRLPEVYEPLGLQEPPTSFRPCPDKGWEEVLDCGVSAPVW